MQTHSVTPPDAIQWPKSSSEGDTFVSHLFSTEHRLACALAARRGLNLIVAARSSPREVWQLEGSYQTAGDNRHFYEVGPKRQVLSQYGVSDYMGDDENDFI